MILGAMLPGIVSAAIPDTYTNDNYHTSEHDKPLSFNVDSLGNAEGITETGKKFTQRNVSNSYGIRLQKFTIDQAFFYISDQGVIFADSDLEAISIYLSKTV